MTTNRLPSFPPLLLAAGHTDVVNVLLTVGVRASPVNKGRTPKQYTRSHPHTHSRLFCPLSS